MKKSHLQMGLCLAAFALCGVLVSQAAQKKEAPASLKGGSPAMPASTSPSPAAKAPRAIPFRGVIALVDASAKTFTITGKTSSRIFKVTDKTTVTKAGAAATFSDLAASENVTGSYWKQEDGSLEAKTVKVGGASKSSEKETEKGAAAEVSPSPSPKK